MRERPVKLDLIGFIELERAHVADHADNLGQVTGVVVGPEPHPFADRVVVREKALRGRFAKEDNERFINCVTRIEVAAGEQRDAERSKKPRGYRSR